MKNDAIGCFQENGRVYHITNLQPPRPLMNYLWNPSFLSAVNHFGGGNGAYGDRAAYYIDPENRGRATLIRNGNRYFYLRDGGTGEVWNPGWYPSCHPLDEYACDHTPGSTTIRGEFDGIQAEATVFVPENATCEAWQIALHNQTDRQRALDLFTFVEFSLEGYPRYSEYDSYVRAFYDEDRHMIYARNDAQERPHHWYDGFIAGDKKPAAYETSKKRFLGAYGDIARPQQLRQGESCSCCETACEDMAGVLCYHIELAPGETWDVRLLIGSSDSKETADTMCALLWKEDFHARKAAAEQQCIQRALTSSVQTPEPRLNHIYNYWVKQQVAMCTEVGRSTGKGFRDTLQDAMALCTFSPMLAREKLIETLGHQYADGRCPRGWLPLDPHIYSDGPVWIAPAVNAYIKETGDFALLDTIVSYVDKGEGSVWAHMLQAVLYSSSDVGAHGLVLAHDGDWNDSLNGMGVGGKGESVWTSIALYSALGDMLELARFTNCPASLLHDFQAMREKIAHAVRTEGWDGKWFLAGFDDKGVPVGSHKEKEGMIYLNPQTWAVLTEIASAEQRVSCLKAVDTYLEGTDGTLTLYPPYTHYQPSIGRLTGFVPGIWENGTPYCHGAMFKVVADFACGRADNGWETLLKILPDSSGNPSLHSGCEPYVFTNMYLGPANPRAGETSFAWVTGTAGWALRAVSEYLFGFKPGYYSFVLRPSLPSSFHHAYFTRCFRGAVYRIEYVQGKNKELYIDTIAQDPEKALPIFKAGETHNIKIICP